MNFWYIGIIAAIVLFFVGMKVLKWLMWGLAILALGVAAYFYF